MSIIDKLKIKGTVYNMLPPGGTEGQVLAIVNGQLAWVDLVDEGAIHSLTVGNTTTGEPGTNASVNNSGTTQAPVLNFTIPRGADGQDGADGRDGQDAVNPFKGWYPSAASLPSSPKVGDYAYVKGSNAGDPATIYECTTAGTWSNSGETVDTSNVQTFASGEEVNETHIDDTHLSNPKDGALPTANDTLQLKSKLEGVTATETKVIPTLNSNYYNGKYVKNNKTIQNSSTPSGGVPNGILIVNVSNIKRVRFLGFERSTETTAGYGFSANPIDPTSTSEQLDYAFAFNGSASSARAVEIEVDVPKGMNWFVCTIYKYGTPQSAVMTLEEFYCYIKSGDTVMDTISVKADKSEVNRLDVNLIATIKSGYAVLGTGTNIGNLSKNSNYSYCDYLYVGNCKKIEFLGVEYQASTVSLGFCFYDKDKNALSGSPYVGKSVYQAKVYNVKVPAGAVYFRATISNALTLSDFYVKGETEVKSAIVDLQNEVDNLSSRKIYKSISIDEADYVVRIVAETGGTTSSSGNRINIIFDLTKHDFRNKVCTLRQPNGGGVFVGGYEYYTYSNKYMSTKTRQRFGVDSYTTEEKTIVFPSKFECHYIRFLFKKSDNSNFTDLEMDKYLSEFEFKCEGYEYSPGGKEVRYPLPEFVNGIYKTSGTAGCNTSSSLAPYRAVCKDYTAVPHDSCMFRVVLPEDESYQFAFAIGDSGDVSFPLSWFKNGDVFQIPYGITHFVPMIARYKSDGTTDNDNTIDASVINSLVRDGKIALLYASDSITDRIVSESYIEQVMDKYKPNDRPHNVPRNAAIFVHTSDIHGDVVRWRNALDFAKKYNVDAVINTGDNVAHSVGNGMSFVASSSKEYGIRVLITTGNHDTSDKDNESFENNLNGGLYTEVIQDFAEIDSNKYILPSQSEYDTAPTYYFSDIDDKKIRFIALNLYETGRYRTNTDDGTYSRLSQKQIDWFIATLASTPADYGVIVGYHRSAAPVAKDNNHSKFWQDGYTAGYPPSTWQLSYCYDYPITRIVDAFISRTTLSGTFHQTLANGVDEVVNLTADFSNVPQSVEFIAHLFGHHHRDTIGYYQTPNGSDYPVVNKQLCLNVCQTTSKYSDTYVSWANPSDIARGYGDTVNQDAFNVYVIDRASKTVRIARVGGNVSSETLSPRDYMSIPYAD